MFWSTQRIEAEQAAQTLVQPFSSDRLKRCGYELALSREVVITPEDSKPFAGTQGTGPTLTIPPGQFGFLYTEERVVIPANVIAFISIKAGVKFKGLVNVSGFHVDPGFRGRLKFSVYNAGNQSICLDYGRPYFIIWFSELDKATRDPYDGG